MSYLIKNLVCLANSRKYHGRCIVGKEIERDSIGPWIRAISSNPDGEISDKDRRYENGEYAKVLDVIRIVFTCKQPNSFQVENHLIDESYFWTRINTLPTSRLSKLLDEPKYLWNTGSSSCYGINDRINEELTSSLHNSLYLISPDSLYIESVTEGNIPRRRVRAKFHYKRKLYKLFVTDIEFEDMLLESNTAAILVNKPHGRVYLSISLAPPYMGHCYKLVASIIGYKETPKDRVRNCQYIKKKIAT